MATTKPLALPFGERSLPKMKTTEATVEIPLRVWESVDTLDELEDWRTAQNPRVMRELRQARRDDVAGKFKPLKPRFLPSASA